MGDLDFLKKVDSFQGLSDKQLRRIQAGCRQSRHQQGERLFAEGEIAEHVWVVMDGKLDLRFELPGRPTSEENTVSTAAAGETLGYSSFVPPFKYKLSAYCTTRTCSVIKIEKEFLLNLFEEDTRLGFAVISNLTRVASNHFQQLQLSAGGAPPAKIKITVHMATCGIAAGARQVMTALTEAIARSQRHEIELSAAGCIGRCESHPNVTVLISGEEPVVYQKMTAATARRIFEQHVLKGRVQQDLVLQ